MRRVGATHKQLVRYWPPGWLRQVPGEIAVAVGGAVPLPGPLQCTMYQQV